MNDFFNWGNDRFVLGQLPSQAGNSTLKRKKSPQEIFMEAILDDEEPAKAAATEDTTATADAAAEEKEDKTIGEDSESAASTEESDSEANAAELPKIDIDTLGLDEEEEQPAAEA